MLFRLHRLLHDAKKPSSIDIQPPDGPKQKYAHSGLYFKALQAPQLVPGVQIKARWLD